MARDGFYIADKDSYTAQFLNVTYARGRAFVASVDYTQDGKPTTINSTVGFQNLNLHFFIYEKRGSQYFQQGITSFIIDRERKQQEKTAFENLPDQEPLTEDRFADYFVFEGEEKIQGVEASTVKKKTREKFQFTPKTPVVTERYFESEEEISAVDLNEEFAAETRVISAEDRDDKFHPIVTPRSSSAHGSETPSRRSTLKSSGSPSRVGTDGRPLMVTINTTPSRKSREINGTPSIATRSLHAPFQMQSPTRPKENIRKRFVKLEPDGSHQSPNTDNACFLLSCGALQAGLGAVILLLGWAGLTAATLGTSTFFVSAAAVMVGPMLMGLGLFNSTCGHPDRERMDPGSRLEPR